MRPMLLIRTTGLALMLAASAANATDLHPTVFGSIHDQPLDGSGDAFNAFPFEGLLRKGTASGLEDRAIQEFDASAFVGGVLQSAHLSGTISSNNSFDVGVRTFDFALYPGNGAADVSDFQIASIVVGSGNYHPPMETSFPYSFDVGAAAQALLDGGASWIGLKVVCTSDPNYPDILGLMPSKLALVAAPTTGTPFCSGDGSGTPCPCGNASAVGANVGCLSSLGIGGKLAGSGVASVTNDSFRLDGSNLPNAPGLYFQGTAPTNGGLGAVFGDGLRCVAGTVIRLGIKPASSGASHYPGPNDLSVSAHGLVPPGGGTYHYQLWYRNSTTFCSASTFNLTNGWRVSWIP